MANTNILDAERESFHRFFECWLDEQNQHLHDLTIAARNNTTATTTAATNPATTTAAINTSSTSLGKLVERVVKHYEHYYEVKSRWAKQDVLGNLPLDWWHKTHAQDAQKSSTPLPNPPKATRSRRCYRARKNRKDVENPSLLQAMATHSVDLTGHGGAQSENPHLPIRNSLIHVNLTPCVV